MWSQNHPKYCNHYEANKSILEDKSDIQNFTQFQKQINLVSKTNEFQMHVDLIVQLIQIPFTQNEILTLLLQSLNNLAVNYYKFDLFASKIFKFVSLHLLKNEQINTNQFRYKVVKFIVQLNMAKIKFQLGFYGKAFLLAEQAMSTIEKDLIDRLKHKDSKIEDAMLLINGYFILAKSYQFSSITDLQCINDKSIWAQNTQQNQFCKFYQNAEQLAIKYLGTNNQIFLKLQHLNSNLPKQPKIPQQKIQSINRLQLNQLIQLFKLIKDKVTFVIQPEKLLFTRFKKKSIESQKTNSIYLRQSEYSKPYFKKFRIKSKQKSNSFVNSSDETTKEKVNYFDLSYSQSQQLETIIQKKVEEQLQIKLEQRIQLGLKQYHFEDQNKLLKQNQKISKLQDQVLLLKEQLKEKQELHDQQQREIDFLTSQNILKYQKNVKCSQIPIQNNAFINECELSTEEQQFFVQNANKNNSNEINKFKAEQIPIYLVNSVGGKIQNLSNQSSTVESQAKIYSIPSSLNFHYQLQKSDEEQLYFSPCINNFHQPQQLQYKKIQKESMNFSFTYCKINLLSKQNKIIKL